MKWPWQARIIGDDKTDPLLFRWVLFSCPLFGVMVHKLCRSDHDRALHDHPWDFISIVLANGYTEEYWNPVTETKARMTHRAGDVLRRPCRWRHRVIITDRSKPAWTLVIKSARRRPWGFWVERPGFMAFWCWWRKYDENMGICDDTLMKVGGED